MIFLILYLLNGALTIFAEQTQQHLLMYVTKVLMMPLLAMYMYSKLKDIRPLKFIIVALFFSWLGDIFLMFPGAKTDPHAQLLFVFGLLSFLIAHINYILHFIRELNSVKKVTLIVEKPFLVFPFLLILILLLKLLYPGLGPMKFPVTMYALIIITMLLMAFNRYKLVGSTSFCLVFFGAALFVLSDSCIAINVFYVPFEAASLVIMSTYIIAQLMIVEGVTRNLAAHHRQ